MSKAIKKRAGIVGWPISQSLSPTMHAHWMAQYGIDAEYLPLGVPPEEFSERIVSLSESGFAGVNVTIPHKQAAYSLSSTLDADARAAGAVNLLIFQNEKIHGRNTDVSGFSAALNDSLGEGAARNGPVVLLGAGGAARAVVIALVKNGAKEIRILNRTCARAEGLAKAVEGARIKVFEWGDWLPAFADAGLLVNTTSLGMVGKEPLDIALEALPAETAVADIVYNPHKTALLRKASAQGLRTMDGLGMLMHQAAPAFAAWFGITPIVTRELRMVLEAKLNG